ncbi:hypothetical protein L9F63_002608, partial [Diploptera punctata]
NLIIMNCQIAVKHEDPLSDTEIGPQDVKVEIMSDGDEQTHYVDVKCDTYPTSEEIKLEGTSDPVKKEIEDMVIEPEILIGENLEDESEEKIMQECTALIIVHKRKIRTCHRSTLNNHLLVHSKEKPFKCLTCDKSFSRRSTTLKHIYLYINNEKPFKCSICNKSFVRKSILNNHLLVHSKDKPFQCTTCSKSFSRKAHLNTHALLHSDDKPFKCTICNKSFVQKFYFNTHLLTHSDEKPFKCTVCNKSFVQKCHFKKHVCSQRN